MAEDKKDKRNAEGQASFVDRVRTNIEGNWTATTAKRNKVRECFDMVIGGERQWESTDVTDLKAQNRPVLSFNVSQANVNFLAGYQSEREQDYRYFPRGSEDEELGRITTALVKYGRDVCDDERLDHQLFRQGIIGGESVKELTHSFDFSDDFLEGDVYADVLPENASFTDPGARRYDRCDAEFDGKLLWISRDNFTRRWKDGEKDNRYSFDQVWDGTGADPRTTGVPDHLLPLFLDRKNQKIRLIQYWYQVPTKAVLLANMRTGQVERFSKEQEADNRLKQIRDEAGRDEAAKHRLMLATQQTEVANVTTGQTMVMPSPDEAEQMMQRIKTQAGAAAAAMFKTIVRDYKALRVAHLTAWNLLDDKASPYDDNWRYPRGRFIPYQDTDDYNAIKGILHDLIDPQREINWWISTMQDMLLRGPKGGFWVNKADQHNIQKLKQEISRSGFLGEYTQQPPTYVPPANLSPGDQFMLQTMMESMMRISGLNAELMGQTTQKTVSGRAIGARQAGGLVGVASLLMNWTATKRYMGQLWVRRVKQYYSPEKMARIIGQSQKVAQEMGLLGQTVQPQEQLFALFKRIPDVDMDVVVGFQEAAATAREAVSNRLLQLAAAGFPIPPEVVLEASDVPYKEEIKAALAKQGMQPPNEALAKVLGAGQGQGAPQPNGVNAS